MSASLPPRLAQPLNLPTLPRIVRAIQELLEAPHTGLRDIGTLIGEDAPLTARVLQIVNSSYYGLRERCESPQHACVILGTRVLHDIVLQATLLQDVERLRESGFDVDDLWHHSVATAHLCGLLARRTRGVDLNPDEMYVTGLLHDVGHVVLIDNLRDEYVALIEKANRMEIPLVHLERRELHVTHSEVGEMVATSWGFSSTVAAAIRAHHDPRDSGPLAPASMLLRGANHLVRTIEPRDVDAAEAIFDPLTCKVLGLTQRDVHAAVSGTARVLSEIRKRSRAR